MIINSIYIENYGGLSNFKLDFTDDLNIINEHNGYGKSTINSFIKAMFYGLPNSTKRDIDSNEFAHYQPWNGGKCGGNLIFTVGDKTYRIEREFDKEIKVNDYIGTFKLYDNKTNLESDDYSRKIGFELFGVDESTYMTTVYAGQGKVNSPMGDSLLSKLKDAANEDNNSEDEYSKAIKSLDEKRAQYQRKGGAGLIPDIENRINENNITIANSSDMKAKVLQRQREIADLNEEVLKYDKQREEFKEEIVKAEKNSVNKSNKDKKENLDKRLEEIQKEISTYDDYFCNGIPTDEELDGILEKITNMENLKGMEFKAGDFASNYEEIHVLMEKNNITKDGIDACRNKLSEIQKDEETIDSLEMDVREESDKLYDIEKPNNTVLTVIGILLIVAGIVAAAVLYYVTASFVVALAGLVICLLSIICFVMSSSKNKEYEKAKAKAEKEVEAKEKKLNDKKIECEGKRQSLNFFLGDFLKLGDSVEGILSKMDFVLNEKNKYNDELKKVEDQKSANQAKIEAIDAEILSDIQKYEPYARGGYNYKEIVKVIRDKNNKYAVLNSSIQEVKNELDKIPAEDYQVEEGLRSIEELQRLDDEIHNKRLEVMNQINIYKNEIEDYNDILSEAERLAEENKDLEEKLKEAKKTFKIIQDTMKYIEEAKTSFSSRYINDINKNMKKYIDMIDNKDGLEFQVDTNFKIHNTSSAITRDFKYSSVGIRELVMVALRFALIDTLFTEEYPTIIWDDPFVNLDDDNLQRGMSLLKEISKNKQIIYFTCSKSRA